MDCNIPEWDPDALGDKSAKDFQMVKKTKLGKKKSKKDIDKNEKMTDDKETINKITKDLKKLIEAETKGQLKEYMDSIKEKNQNAVVNGKTVVEKVEERKKKTKTKKEKMKSKIESGDVFGVENVNANKMNKKNVGVVNGKGKKKGKKGAGVSFDGSNGQDGQLELLEGTEVKSETVEKKNNKGKKGKGQGAKLEVLEGNEVESETVGKKNNKRKERKVQGGKLQVVVGNEEQSETVGKKNNKGKKRKQGDDVAVNEEVEVALKKGKQAIREKSFNGEDEKEGCEKNGVDNLNRQDEEGDLGKKDGGNTGGNVNVKINNKTKKKKKKNKPQENVNKNVQNSEFSNVSALTKSNKIIKFHDDGTPEVQTPSTPAPPPKLRDGKTIFQILNSDSLPKKKVRPQSLPLRQRMMQRLKAARFRYINEQIYTAESKEAEALFKEDPTAFLVYHEGYKQQVKKWPMNPLDNIIQSIQKLPNSFVIADFGCGEGKLARSVEQKVHSFDLVAADETVTACDMKNVPLKNNSVDAVVFCLSLMGTNLNEYLLEANRVLKTNGILKIAEVESRFDAVDNFIEGVRCYGFKNTWKDLSHNLFYFMDFKKERDIKKKKKLPTIGLHPCLYKRR